MEDKRNFERFDLEVPAKVGIKGADQKEVEVSLLTKDICAGGAYMETKEPLPAGTRVKVDFVISIEKLKEMLDSHCRVVVEGEVVRTDENGIAVRFEDNYQIMPVKGEQS
ncbi:PilZ domain-containing protein [Thermodesulfobacteriota bacterium]